MTKEKKSLISEEFLTELAEEINNQYGFPDQLSQQDIVDDEEND
ncbi:bacitracin ABC transporter ATP-binding protein [Bacillus sp. NEB1478]|nr:bacitracin ABC transporter ATP-binding protein [Bacillus sp. NEB1478]WNB90969.1 bacitracin ABC transporter ATP-binding protein [Bacillus sp. NEB1478]